MSLAFLAEGTASGWAVWLGPIATGVIVGVVGAMVSAYFTARWAIRKHQATRWWDAKYRVYCDIMDALDDARMAAAEVWRADGQTPPVKESADKLRKSTEVIGSLLLSGEARRRFDDFKECAVDGARSAEAIMAGREGRGTDDASAEKAAAELFASFIAEMESLLKDVPAIARRDLGVRPGSE